MVTVRLIGRVLPLHRQVNLIHPGITFDATELGVRIIFNIKIVNSVVTVDCVMPKFEKEKHFLVLDIHAQDFVMTALNLISFSSGIGHSMIWETLIEPDGTSSSIESIFPFAATLSTSLKTESDFVALLQIVSINPPLFRALHNLMEGIYVPHASGVNCGRVLDALRKLIAPTLKTEQGWAELRSILRVERSYLDLISDTSKNPRHGDFTRIKGDVTTEVGIRTWTLMNRYLEFRKRGDQPLPDSEFPILS